ncbi:hypothetical protein HMPREF1624_05496 [Sporothrix schenckii ATCC 58251]|uniref:Uncharacterized protein n=1 Tax=Sporothrix schenckii (strain ATCC 58251 / de Perez 2211183) TaxID=1391915 RepID=U7PVC1_SPOS1|nr:hypothetical protein HMPREF1624_05496 [Sporothrix schenckii ATCC 58251]
MHHPRNADLFEDVCKDRLPNDDIFVPPQHQPINPEDEDDVVPDQHAAFGIQRATQAVREPAWKDLGLSQLMRRGPRGARGGGGGGAHDGSSMHATGGSGAGSGGASGPGGVTNNSYGYYAYYYGYNANGIGAGLAGAGGGGGGFAGDPAASPGPGGVVRGQSGAGSRPYRGMPR